MCSFSCCSPFVEERPIRQARSPHTVEIEAHQKIESAQLSPPPRHGRRRHYEDNNISFPLESPSPNRHETKSPLITEISPTSMPDYQNQRHHLDEKDFPRQTIKDEEDEAMERKRQKKLRKEQKKMAKRQKKL